MADNDKKNEEMIPAPDEHAAFDQAAMDEVMKKYDRESNTRVWEGWQKWVVCAVMALFSLFVIYVTLFATWLDLVRYPSFMGGVLLIGYLVFPVKKGLQKVNHIPWYDWILMLAGAGAFFYVVANAGDLTVRLGMSQLRSYEIRSAQAMHKTLARLRDRLEACSQKRVLTDPTAAIDNRRIALDHTRDRFCAAQERILSEKKQSFVRLASSLDAMSPLRVLARGYAVASDERGRTVKSASSLRRDMRLRLRLADGSADCRVEEVMMNEQGD